MWPFKTVSYPALRKTIANLENKLKEKTAQKRPALKEIVTLHRDLFLQIARSINFKTDFRQLELAEKTFLERKGFNGEGGFYDLIKLIKRLRWIIANSLSKKIEEIKSAKLSGSLSEISSLEKDRSILINCADAWTRQYGRL